MPETPGQVAYEAYWKTFAPQFGPTHMHPWHATHPQSQAAWEAAAQAVLDQRDFPPLTLTPQEDAHG